MIEPSNWVVFLGIFSLIRVCTWTSLAFQWKTSIKCVWRGIEIFASSKKLWRNPRQPESLKINFTCKQSLPTNWHLRGKYISTLGALENRLLSQCRCTTCWIWHNALRVSFPIFETERVFLSSIFHSFWARDPKDIVCWKNSLLQITKTSSSAQRFRMLDGLVVFLGSDWRLSDQVQKWKWKWRNFLFKHFYEHNENKENLPKVKSRCESF